MSRNVPPQNDPDQQITDLHADGHGCREIARQLDMSPSTISRAAARLGLQFDRAQTVAAAAAVTADHVERRAVLSDQFLDLAEQAVAKARTIADTGGADDVAADVRQWTTVAGIAADKHAVLHRVDNGDQVLIHRGPTPGLDRDLAQLATFVDQGKQ